MTEAERGFKIAQLKERHWVIRSPVPNSSPQITHGPGVVGRYPILCEGGFIERNEMHNGAFSYCSRTGGYGSEVLCPLEQWEQTDGVTPGYFEGHIVFEGFRTEGMPPYKPEEEVRLCVFYVCSWSV